MFYDWSTFQASNRTFLKVISQKQISAVICCQLQKVPMVSTKSPPRCNSFVRSPLFLKKNHSSWTSAGQNPLLSSSEDFFFRNRRRFPKYEGIFFGIWIDVECESPQEIPAWFVNYGRRNTWLSLERACIRSSNPAPPSPEVQLVVKPLTWPGTVESC